MSGPATRMNEDLCKEIADVLIEFANGISQKLGYVQTDLVDKFQQIISNR